jgi:aryl-alcohol dehydrogenase-like predicted oxidoreductase
MNRTRLGTTDLTVSEIGVGCARIGGIFQREASGFVDLLSAALDAGINFFDTSDMYSQGESERLLGRAFRDRRDKVVLATKAGYCLPAQRRLVARLKPIARPIIRMLGIKRENMPSALFGAPTQDFSPGYLQSAVEGSLKRLGTDHIDLFQLHSPPADVVRRGDWASALDALKRAGKIRYYGVSCDTREAALAALDFKGVSCLQIQMSLLEHSTADAVLPKAREAGAGVIARECLANGLLAKDASRADIEAVCRSPEEAELRSRQLDTYGKIAESNGCTLFQLGMEFVMRSEGVSVALIGVRTREQLARNVRQLAAPESTGKALREAVAVALPP